MSELLSIPEAAAYLNVKERWVRYAISRRLIPFVKVGHLVRFERADLDKYIASRRVPAQDK